MAATEAGGCRSSPFTTTLPGCPASTNEESWTDSEVDSSCSGQPIHLWQFLKELLLKPHSYGRFIRWLNKEKGKLTPVEGARCRHTPGHRGNEGLERPVGARLGSYQAQGGVGAGLRSATALHFCLKNRCATITGPIQGLRVICTHVWPGYVLLRIPIATQCL